MKIVRNSRKHERVRVRGLIKYALDADPSHFYVKNIYEISETGLSFLTYPKLEAGTKIRVSILLFPKETPIELNATVVRCLLRVKKPATYQASLRFLDMSEKEETALRKTLLLFLKRKRGKKSFQFVVRFHD